MNLVMVSLLFLVIVTIVIMYQRVHEAFACGCKQKKKKCMSSSSSCDTKYIPWPIFFGIPQKEEERPPLVIRDPPQPEPILIMPTRSPAIIMPDTIYDDEIDLEDEMEPEPVDLPMMTFPPVETQTQAPKVTLAPPLDSRKGVLDPQMRLSGTILADVRKEMYPLINRERTCANLKGFVADENLNEAAQKLALEVIEYDLRTDYPHLSILDQVTVDDRVKATQWKGGVGAGNIDQIIQFSKLLYDTNRPTMVIRDIMCDVAGSHKKIMMNEGYTSIGIGYGRGNSSDVRTNTKSVYVLLFGKDPSVKAPPITPPKDGNCTNWSIQSACAAGGSP